MRIYDIQAHATASATTLVANVLPDSEASPRQLWFRYEGHRPPVEVSADPFAAAMLPFCMYDREPLEIAGAISPELERNLAQAQQVLAGWFDYLEPVPVLPLVRSEPRPEMGGDGVACCFSAGVDSWYSLLTHMDRVSHLFLIRGFDIGLANDALWQAAKASARDVGRELGKPLVTCTTNLRLIADKGRAGWGRPWAGDFWGNCLHGAALSATALPLGGTFGEIVVPATHTHEQLKPWGSSPLLDRFWSNGQVRIGHDSCDYDRVQKVGIVATSQLALDTLRVCYHDLDEVNCGRCEKCLRTMMALRVHGALNRAGTFPGDEAFARVRRLEIPPNQMHHYDVLLKAARNVDDRELERLIEIAVGRRFSAERSLALLVRRLRRANLSAPLRLLKHPVKPRQRPSRPSGRVGMETYRS
ncbi:MAG: hypothetical protein WD270_09110 [Acetobacterales bacterium]